MVSIDKKHLIEIWPSFVEMKARRDLGVHNNWVTNGIYLRKLKEIGFADHPSTGMRLIPDFAYLDVGSRMIGSCRIGVLCSSGAMC